MLSALSRALDLTEGQPPGHSVRNALIGMRIGDAIGLEAARRSALFYALLLKDLGCSSNAAKVCYLFGSDDRETKRDLKLRDWTSRLGAAGYVARNVARGAPLWKRAGRFLKVGLEGGEASRELFEIRCERGADIARMLGFSDATAAAIHDLDEHWDGSGHPDGKSGTEIPLLARILGLAQTMEVFASEYGVEAAYRMADERSGSWFDPELVEAARSFMDDGEFWSTVRSVGPDAALGGAGAPVEGPESALERWEPEARVLVATEERVDRIARAFARVVDAKSPWTYRHSEKVTEVAVEVARHLGFREERVRELRRACLLHDIGKLGISNLLLDKEGRLTDEELAHIRRHPEFSYEILRRVVTFERVSELARDHHERLDGGGYCRGVGGEALGPSLRVLSVADVYEALTADRPYREAMSPGRALEVMGEEVGSHFGPEAFRGLEEVLERKGPPPWRSHEPMPSESAGPSDESNESGR